MQRASGPRLRLDGHPAPGVPHASGKGFPDGKEAEVRPVLRPGCVGGDPRQCLGSPSPRSSPRTTTLTQGPAEMPPKRMSSHSLPAGWVGVSATGTPGRVWRRDPGTRVLIPPLYPAHADLVYFTPYLGKGTDEYFGRLSEVLGQLVDQLSHSHEGSRSPGRVDSLRRRGGSWVWTMCRGQRAPRCDHTDTHLVQGPQEPGLHTPCGWPARAQPRSICLL